MLNIKTLNFKNTLKNNYINGFGFKKQTVQNTAKYPNLAPLNKDMVSFKGLQETKTAINNYNVCATVHKCAHITQDKIIDIISASFNDLIFDKNKNPSGFVKLDSRIKTPVSVQEKVADKISKALEKEDNLKSIFAPFSKTQIKQSLHDIIGARITMLDVDENHGKIVDKLCETIEQNHLVVDEVDNHTTSDVKPYFNDDDIDRLLKVINKQRDIHGLKPIELTKSKPDPQKDSGYMALHLDIDMSSEAMLSKNRGYHCELQFIGADVEKLKGVEDLCYKIKNGKDIYQNHPAYAPFKDHFTKYYRPGEESKEAEEIHEQFRLYTKAAYKLQRNKKRDVDGEEYLYPTIKECGFEGKVPKELDFNVLSKIKAVCDETHNAYGGFREIEEFSSIYDGNNVIHTGYLSPDSPGYNERQEKVAERRKAIEKEIEAA